MASTLAQTSPVASQAKRRYEDSPSQRKWRSIPWVVTVTMNWPRLFFSSTQPEASSDLSISASSPPTAGFQSGSFTARARVARRSSFDTPKYRHEFQSDNKNLAIWPTRPHSSGDNERPWAVVPMGSAISIKQLGDLRRVQRWAQCSGWRSRTSPKTRSDSHSPRSRSSSALGLWCHRSCCATASKRSFRISPSRSLPGSTSESVRTIPIRIQSPRLTSTPLRT